MKNNKGITLIALVVTIIVLLILAGVSIAMLTGDNGILNRASQSSVANAIGEGKDQVGLKVAECTADYFDWKYNGVEVSGLTKGNPTANPATQDTKLIDYIVSKFANGAMDKQNFYTIEATSSSITVRSVKDSTKNATCTINNNGTITPWQNNF